MSTERIDRHLKLSRILFAALLMSLGIYAVIAYVIVTQRSPDTPIPQPQLATEPFAQPLVLGLGVAALVILALTPLLRAKLLPARAFGDSAPRSVDDALNKLRAAEIVTWALCESIAVFGLILTMLSYEPRFTYVAAGVAALAMLAYAPNHKLVMLVVRASGS
jgi:hypothetical protein